MNNHLGNLWPGWETVRLIGRGSFGAVYEIERDVLGEKEKAALKVISIPQSDSDIGEMFSDGYDEESITNTFQEHLKNIVAEYTLMRKLNGSTNVVNCDDVRYIQHDDGFGWDIFIKMELLTPLTEALPAKVPEEQVVRIAKDLCRALVRCRLFDIVHRDIKPQNIFVSPLGDYKLGDFGIAKTVEKTSGGTKIGTYKYMAPEVYNDQPYGAGADIYSLGLVLYWLLNERRLPFLPLPPEKLRPGMEEQARSRRFHGETIPAPAHGSEALKCIVLKACAFAPKDRYQNAEEMLLDLEALDGAERQHMLAAGVLTHPEKGINAAGFRAAAEELEDKPTISALYMERTARPEEGRAAAGFHTAAEELEDEPTISALHMERTARPEEERAAAGFRAAAEETDDEATISVLHTARLAHVAPTEGGAEKPADDEAAQEPPSAESFAEACGSDSSDPLLSAPNSMRSNAFHVQDGVSDLNSRAFSKCNVTRITDVYLPVSVTTIRAFTFFYFEKLENIYFAGTKEQWRDIYIGAGNSFLYRANIHYEPQQLSAPAAVAHAKEGSGPEEAGGPVDDDAFVVTDGVRVLSDYSFSGCASLSALRSVYLPLSLTTIRAFTFDCFENLTDVYYAGTREQWVMIDVGNGNTHLSQATIHFAGRQPEPPVSDTSTETESTASEKPIAPSDKGSYVIPDGICVLNDYSFSGCASLSALRSVYLPSSLTTIRAYTFQYCENLTDVYYAGTQEQWNLIEFGKGNEPLSHAQIHFSDAWPLKANTSQEW